MAKGRRPPGAQDMRQVAQSCSQAWGRTPNSHTTPLPSVPLCCFASLGLVLGGGQTLLARRFLLRTELFFETRSPPSGRLPAEAATVCQQDPGTPDPTTGVRALQLGGEAPVTPTPPQEAARALLARGSAGRMARIGPSACSLQVGAAGIGGASPFPGRGTCRRSQENFSLNSHVCSLAQNLAQAQA